MSNQSHDQWKTFCKNVLRTMPFKMQPFYYYLILSEWANNLITSGEESAKITWHIITHFLQLNTDHLSFSMKNKCMKYSISITRYKHYCQQLLCLVNWKHPIGNNSTTMQICLYFFCFWAKVVIEHIDVTRSLSFNLSGNTILLLFSAYFETFWRHL
jgi:hypothetical protein